MFMLYIDRCQLQKYTGLLPENGMGLFLSGTESDHLCKKNH